MEVKIKVGDVINFRYNSFFSKTITMGMGHYWSHSGWVRKVEGNKIFIQEAQGSRTKQVTTNEYDLEWLNQKWDENKLMIMNFNIRDNVIFENYCESIEGNYYDYYAILELMVTRFMVIFGLNSERFFKWALLGRLRTKINPNFTSEKLVDCSESVARGIAKLTNIDVLTMLGVNKFEQVTPQLLSVLYYKLKYLKEI